MTDRLTVLAMVEPHSPSGSLKAVLELAREAREERPNTPRIDLSLLTFDRGQDLRFLSEAASRLALPLDRISERHRFDLGVISQLLAVVRERKPAVIWSNSVKSHFLVRLAGLHRSARWLAFHHGYTSTDLKMKIYNLLDRWSLPRADSVITSASAFVDDLVRKRVKRARIRVQHMPVHPFLDRPDTEKAKLRNSLGLDSGTRVLLSVGRLSHEKGHAALVRALPEIRKRAGTSPIKLVLVGNGPEHSRIQRLSHQLNLSDAVLLAGQQVDVCQFFGVADIFVLPSLTEGCPNALLEAMAAGVPVVANAVGDIPELVKDGQEALLVRRNDQEGLVSAVVRLLRDPILRDRLSSRGREIVARNSADAYFRSMSTHLLESRVPGE